MDLRIVGGHAALDLANTVAPRPPAAVEVEFLPDPDALLEWAQHAGVIDAAEAERVERAWTASPGAAEAVLADVLALRDLIDPVLAGEQLDVLSRRWAAAIDRSTLVAAGDNATLAVGTDPTSMIADRLADAVVDLLRTADLSRLRACPVTEGGCGFLFLDRSRNLSRRWCSMEDCGTHAKSRRLTERRRSKR
jgi:predicted RNA-binding Zn ribbon-like protein